MKTCRGIVAALLVLASTVNAFGYSIRTAYEDSADSAPEAFWLATFAVALAYPLFLIIICFRFRGQETPFRWSFPVFCARVAAKGLFPLLCLVYMAGSFVLLGEMIALTSISRIIPSLQSVETLNVTMWISYIVWYVFSLIVSIRWLPKTPSEC